MSTSELAYLYVQACEVAKQAQEEIKKLKVEVEALKEKLSGDKPAS